jgi:hypothetical protein
MNTTQVQQESTQHIIDCDADPLNPFVKDGGVVHKHQKGGPFTWDRESQADALLLLRSQSPRSVTQRGWDHSSNVISELRSRRAPVLNACVLDFLLANPQQIPREWKGKHVFFWGTIYYARRGGHWGVDLSCVRQLNWDNGRWDWDVGWLDDALSANSPAAVRAY